MSIDNFFDLKRFVVQKVNEDDVHDNIVNLLKDIYRLEIDSPRRYEQITTIGELLDVLELRDVLSFDNVNCLKHIAKRLSNIEETLNKIQEYETSVKMLTTNTTDMNFYRKQTSAMPENVYKRNLEKVKLIIINEMSTTWRHLARNLGIKENRIIQIDNDFNKVTDKINQLLKDHGNIHNHTKFFQLCQAIEKSRRRDISLKIKEIMTIES